jgi:hypothetical protein
VIGLADLWTTPLRLDPNWRGGDYYDREPPAAGLAQSLKLVTLSGRHWGWAARTYGHAPGARGGRGDMFVLQGDGGHLDGLFEIAQAGQAIRRFLTTD